MKVFIIMEWEWELNEIVSIHSTRESAETELKKYDSVKGIHEYGIDEHEVID